LYVYRQKERFYSYLLKTTLQFRIPNTAFTNTGYLRKNMTYSGKLPIT